MSCRVGSSFVSNILEGSWVVISGVVSSLIWVRTVVALLTTPLITTHEPPSRLCLGQSLGLEDCLHHHPL